MNKLLGMINQEFKALGRKYEVLPNFGIICRELEGPQSYEFWHMPAQFLLCSSQMTSLSLFSIVTEADSIASSLPKIFIAVVISIISTIIILRQNTCFEPR